MPAWNEAEGIKDFIIEINNSISSENVVFWVVDDFSTDDTAVEITNMGRLGIDVRLLRNHENIGHGPSTLRALKAGLDSGAEFILSVDGDGQFLGRDIEKILRALKTSECDVFEGVRIRRGEPNYRRFTSMMTRTLVWIRVREWVSDANTPLRVYRRDCLEVLLRNVPENSPIPNLFISALSRKRNLKIGSMVVLFGDRRGTQKTGTTWGKSKSYLPSRRFLKFCTRATSEWLKYKI
jgi:glycosyltransferase involved in cell wall biosynthesis